MLDIALWTIVLVVVGPVLRGCVYLTESTSTDGLLAPVRTRVLGAAGCAVLLVLLALAYQVRGIARPDGALVEHLAGSSTSSLAKAMTYLTLIGDSIPCLLIATILAIVIQRQGVHRYLPFLLPAVVLAELYVQLGMGKVFDDYTIDILHPDVPIGGAGFIPSGSVARLLSVFLIAARLWSDRSPIGGRRVATLGATVVAVEIVSRLVLGRHLVADIAGGVLLGLFLTLAATLIIRTIPESDNAPAHAMLGSLPDGTDGVWDDDRGGSRPVLATRIRLRRSTRG